MAGGVINGQPVDEAVTNPAFIIKNADDFTVHKVGLKDPAEGVLIDSAQKALDTLMITTGATETIAGTVYGAPASTIDDGDDHQFALSKLAFKFFATFPTGHAHTGVDGQGPKIQAVDVDSVPLKGYVIQGTDLVGVSGLSEDISTEMAGKIVSTGATVQGVPTSSPYNKIMIRQASGTDTDDVYKDTLGNIVYGRITESVGVWTLSFYVLLSTVETAYSFPAPSDVRWYFQELFNPLQNPPVYSEFAVVPSENTTSDVLNATQTEYGKTILQNVASTEVGSSSTVGSANGRVANENHAHKGVHSLGIFGDATKLYGDVDLEEGSGVILTRVGQRITIDNNAVTFGNQETPTGTVDGVNDTFILSQSPLDDESLLVTIDGVVRPETEWTLTGTSLVFGAGFIPQLGQNVYVFYLISGTPPVPPPAPTGTEFVEYPTLTPTNITDKKVVLSGTPAIAANTMLDIIGGGPQVYGFDFTVIGNELSWNGLALDGLLASGDQLRIHYWA